jgi:CPA1 family monovalent cation:H+ antiporter
MSSVAGFELILFLMAVVLALEVLAGRLRMPPAAAFILGGIALALIPGMPQFELDPNLVLVLFLPPLLLSGAYFTSWRDFRREIRIIIGLSVGAVAFTTLAVGVVTHLVAPDLPWAACFALGAIVSPPDAVAAKAVLQRLSLPRRLTMLLEAESLVNDASGLVLYRFAVVAALTGAFSAGEAAKNFAILGFGGVGVGLAFGLLAEFLLRKLQNTHLAVIASFLIAWGSYIAADRIGVSGVLSTVTCGMIMGARQHSVLSATTRTDARAVWRVAEFVMESFVFILIGLSLRGILERLGGRPAELMPFLPASAAIVGAVIVTRFIWIFSTVELRRLSDTLRGRKALNVPFAIRAVMSWAGMRGVVSLAAALALPEGFAGRDFILAVTFAVILVTVLLQGATLAPLARLLRLDRYIGHASQTEREAAARARVIAAQLAEIERHSLQPDGTQRHPRLIEQYSYRSRASRNFAEDVGALIDKRDEHFNVVLAAVSAGRSELLRLHGGNEIHDSVLHAIEQELDLEELTARRALGTAE